MFYILSCVINIKDTILYFYNFQIPIIKNCIFCIDQFILILQKVIKDYYEITNGEMKTIELLIISKHLIRVSDLLYEYIKTSDEYDRRKEIDKIERIKK